MNNKTKASNKTRTDTSLNEVSVRVLYRLIANTYATRARYNNVHIIIQHRPILGQYTARITTKNIIYLYVYSPQTIDKTDAHSNK